MFFLLIYLIILLVLIVYVVILLPFDLYFRIKAVLVLDRVIELTGSRRTASLGMLFIPLVSLPVAVVLVCKARSLLRSMPAEYRKEFGERLQRLRMGVLWSVLRILVLVTFTAALAAWIFRTFYFSPLDDAGLGLILDRVTNMGGLLLLVITSLMLICGYHFIAQLKLVERIVRSLDIETAGEPPRTPPTRSSANVDGAEA